ncbi:hypothetical protein P152DRAFT_285799 [Eremomyces bilateralis CBS 781.70]|uniref:DH domain-containing protein n=1 Tax=Eremomyces bilateralis CBS 781.70 TaxID=1392243 RepID=A0A6G1G680_9PEZI|nr:uncharacterized protein P152DRAFT_285799 [Eremomyces bilateralis CBS 781.70]KAF1813577.1 hypothetical protein P152DRAFT_285799 [Eremomyces bilateralis CBS 781.70]
MEVASSNGYHRNFNQTPPVHSRINHSTGVPSVMHNQAHQSHQSNSSSHFSSFSHLSRASDSTQGTSQSTLYGAPPLPTPTSTPSNGAPPEARDNVLNKRAEKETSLYQICLNLRQRLQRVPGFDDILEEELRDADEDTDPVTLLWRVFRRGYPLMVLYNALQPNSPLVIDETKMMNWPERKRSQAATFKFLQACVNELRFPQDQCFIITDLYSDDTTGFVKVTKVVNRVLDLLVDSGVLMPEDNPQEENPAIGGKKTHRQHIIHELVNTERTYVNHLDLLQQFKKNVEERGIVSGDAIHDIFLNLNALLDFQRRFLIRVEQTNSQPEAEQDWGRLFVLYKDAFKVYETYIANQKKCEKTAFREFEKLRETGGAAEIRQMVESPSILSSFLLKPFQRLSKYPLLLKELRDKGDYDEERTDNLRQGLEAALQVLQATNTAVDREERKEAVEELRGRVEDWKGHRLEGFGELLLHGTFTVLKGDSVNTKDPEREYKIFLFESILLCCKEEKLNKPRKNFTTKATPAGKDGKPRLQLKGRIFMQNVTETVSVSKPGSYTCQIFWKGDPGIENFIVKFNAEEVMKRWASQVDQQRRACLDLVRTSNNAKNPSASATEFTYLKDNNIDMLENPYKEDDDDDDDVETLVETFPGRSDYQIQRSDSETSLRSRSATGDSGPPMSRALPVHPPPRFPMLPNNQLPPLQLRTQHFQNPSYPSPGERAMDSYFSPTAESPISTRTSSSSGMFPHFRQGSMQNGWQPDDNARYTAPAMGRSTSREQIATQRSTQRPSLPAGPNSTSALLTQNRLRSASSPDIAANGMPQHRRADGGSHPPVPDVPVPPFPTHYAYNQPPMNRSQTASPGTMNGIHVPTRAATQSPTVQRDRLMHQRVPEQYLSDYPSARAPPLPRSVTSMDQSRGPPPGAFDPRSHPAPAPPPTSAPRDELPSPPTQLKVKVHCPSAGSSMTLVVSTNISYQSLKDRIDAKLQRSTSLSLSSEQLKLKYLDEDDFVSIQSDEDVQMAFETWREQRGEITLGHMGEIELYCQK